MTCKHDLTHGSPPASLRLTGRDLADFVLPNQACPFRAEGLELNVPDRMSLPGNEPECPRREAHRANATPAGAWSKPPTPRGSGQAPLQRTPGGASGRSSSWHGIGETKAMCQRRRAPQKHTFYPCEACYVPSRLEGLIAAGCEDLAIARAPS